MLNYDQGVTMERLSASSPGVWLHSNQRRASAIKGKCPIAARQQQHVLTLSLAREKLCGAGRKHHLLGGIEILVKEEHCPWHLRCG